jgi:hypothetical protein
MYEAAATCKDISRAPVTNWERLQDTVRPETRDVTVFCHKCGRALTGQLSVVPLQIKVTVQPFYGPSKAVSTQEEITILNPDDGISMIHRNGVTAQMTTNTQHHKHLKSYSL